MAKQYVKDMTTGNELPLLLRFSLPMLVGNIFQQFYNMVDSIVVGNYVGTNALAAVGMTSSLNFLYFALCNGFATGAGVLMSQYFGMKNEKRVKDALGNSVYLLLSRNILELLNTPQEIFDDALLYTRIVCGGIISVVMYNGIAAMLQSLGDSTTPLIFLVVASVLNVIGDLLLVVVFHMGVAGVAIATIIAQLLSALGCIVYAVKKNPYFRLTKENFRPDPALMKKCLRLGIPFGAQGSLIAFSCALARMSSLHSQRPPGSSSSCSSRTILWRRRLPPLRHRILEQATRNVSAEVFENQRFWSSCSA